MTEPRTEAPRRRALVCLPTYDEKENIVDILTHVFGLEPAFDVLVVDDGSPDGTADIVRGLQAFEPVAGKAGVVRQLGAVAQWLDALAFVGEQGDGAAALAGCAPAEVLVLSTGVIGVPLDMAKVEAGLAGLPAAIGAKLAHSMDPKPLKRVFAVFLVLVALNMLRKVLGW